MAVKVVNLQANQNEKHNVELLQEITIQYVVKFYGHFTENQMLYIIMEYCIVSKKPYQILLRIVTCHFTFN